MIKKNKTSTNENDILSLDLKLDTPEKIHHYYQKIIGCMPNNVYWLDRNCITQGCNNNILELVGLKTLDEFIGITYKKMGELAGWTEGQAQSFEKDDREVMATGIPKLDVEEPALYDKQGNPIYYMSSRVPIFDDKGKEVIGVVGISIDITERKKSEKALRIAKEKAEVANQAKTEFLENMRHDIRTPLSGIVGCAQLIQRQSDNPKKVKEFADGLVESSDALLEFLNKILESITVASGEIPLLKRRFKLKEALEQIVHLNRSQAVVKKLALSLVYDETIPSYLIGDDVRVQRIILELLTNALKYTNQGEIRVSARLMKSKERKVIIELRVSDTGIGIPKDKHNEVYTRFTRLTPSYKGVYSGTGLGLSVVKEFIEDLNGEIHIESDVGKGSTFICVIPFQESLLDESEIETAIEKEKEVKGDIVSLKKRAVSDEPSISEMVVFNGSHVLVVDDNPMAITVAKNVLSELGCQIDTAPDGKTALEKIAKNHYDLILMDVGLPDYDGDEVTRRIRLKQWQKKSPVPIIGLTAHIEAEKKQSCLAKGMNVIYNKPLTSEKATEILNSFVPHQHQPQKDIHNKSTTPIQSIAPLLDIKRAVGIIGKKEVVKECLDLLVSDLNKELEVIKQHHEKSDWLAIRNMAHKWRGGASYCGASRLEQACQQIAELTTKSPKGEAEMLYQQLIQVAEETKEAAKKAIKEID